MGASKQEIQNKLNACAQIVRKYNLGDNKYFFTKFHDSDKPSLETAWAFALKKIQHREIIKDTSDLNPDDLQQVNKRISGFNHDTDTLYHYLKSEFDVKQLKLSDENIERRVRRLIADRYLQIVSKEVSESTIKSKNSTKVKTAAFFSKFKYAFLLLLIISGFSAPRIIDGLTPVDILTEKIHEKSKYKFDGSRCNDGSISHSQGRGTCSWHGGVNYKFYKGDYSKTIEECRDEAIKLSWRD
jgi:hypothetical protein